MRALKTKFPCTVCGTPGQDVQRLAEGESIKCERCAELCRLYSLAAWALEGREERAQLGNGKAPEGKAWLARQVADVGNPGARLALWLEAVGKCLDAAGHMSRALQAEFRPKEKARCAQALVREMRRARRDLREMERWARHVEESSRYMRPVPPEAQGELLASAPESAARERPTLHLLRKEDTP